MMTGQMFQELRIMFRSRKNIGIIVASRAKNKSTTNYISTTYALHWDEHQIPPYKGDKNSLDRENLRRRQPEKHSYL